MKSYDFNAFVLLPSLLFNCSLLQMQEDEESHMKIQASINHSDFQHDLYRLPCSHVKLQFPIHSAGGGNDELRAPVTRKIYGHENKCLCISFDPVT